MRSLVRQVVFALALFALGFGCWRAADVQRAVADAGEQMALLRFDRADAAYDEVEQSMGMLQHTPWLAAALTSSAGIDGQRAAANYWRARYASLVPPRDVESGDTVEQTEVTTLRANAAYRAEQQEVSDRGDLLRKLDAAVKSYRDLVRKDPGNADAAFNYEYVVRFRDTVARNTRPTAAPRRDAAKTAAAATAGDLPAGRTMHGDPGAPPAAVDSTQFKLVIPKREDERGPGDKAGDGKLKERRG